MPRGSEKPHPGPTPSADDDNDDNDDNVSSNEVARMLLVIRRTSYPSTNLEALPYHNGGVDGRIMMNVTTRTIDGEAMQPAIYQLVRQLLTLICSLVLPTLLLYVSIYAHVIGHYTMYKLMTFVALASFLACPSIYPISCGPVQCLQNCAVGSKLTVQTPFSSTHL